MLNRFRLINALEGTSYLLLLLVAMPAKYYLDMPLAVTVVGWLHGVLFMAYIWFMLEAAQRYRWSAGFTLWLFSASLIPLACVMVARQLRRQNAMVASCSST